MTDKKMNAFEKISSLGSIMTAILGGIALYEWNSSRSDKELLAKTLLAVQEQASLQAQSFRPILRPTKDRFQLNVIEFGMPNFKPESSTTDLKFQNIGGGVASKVRMTLIRLNDEPLDKSMVLHIDSRNRIGQSGLLDTWEVNSMPLPAAALEMPSFGGLIELSYEDSSRKMHKQYFEFKCETDPFLTIESKTGRPLSMEVKETVPPKVDFYSESLLGHSSQTATTAPWKRPAVRIEDDGRF